MQLAVILYLHLPYSRHESITIIYAFAFHDACPEVGGFSVDESDSGQADLYTDSGAPDADLLELKENINK